MDDFDNDGWSHVHHAAFSGYQKSITRFVRTNRDQIELLTKDGQENTPLLLACSGGQLETVRFLVELGANGTAVNASGYGVVELSSCSGHSDIVEYFLELNLADMNVFESLVRGLRHESGAPLQLACLQSLTELVKSKTNRIGELLNVGAIESIVKLLASPEGEDVIVASLAFLENVISVEQARDLMRQGKAIEAFVRQLGSCSKEIYSRCIKLLQELALDSPNCVEGITNNSGVTALVKIMEKDSSDKKCLLAVLKTLGLFCRVRCKTQDAFAAIDGGFKLLVCLMKENRKRKILASLARTVALLVERNERNQDLFVNEDGISCLVQILMKSKSQEAQLAAVLAIKSIANEGTKANQELLHRKACIKILIKLLKEGSRQDDVRQLLGEALWAIAGTEMSRKYMVAKRIGITILVEFLKTSNASLNYIGSEALLVLADNINSKRNEIVAASATQFLVRLIGKPNTQEETIQSIFRTMRALCIHTGFRPYVGGQKAIVTDGGIKFLIRLIVHSPKTIIQADAAYTLACISLANHDTNAAIMEVFELSPLIEFLTHQMATVRVTVAHALALFAFNNTHNQKILATPGGLLYSMFEEHLHSESNGIKAKAAFQVVTLSRVFPDEDQATTSAAGIEILVSLLCENDEELQALCCNFIAGLSHTRPGIPSAFVSIAAVEILAECLKSTSEKVRCCSAIALGYLSIDKSGQRQLLNVCRRQPLLYKILYRYAKPVKLSEEFVARWKHYRKLSCLPPIKQAIPLVNQSEGDETVTIASCLNETIDDGSEDSMSELSERNLPLLMS